MTLFEFLIMHNIILHDDDLIERFWDGTLLDEPTQGAEE